MILGDHNTITMASLIDGASDIPQVDGPTEDIDQFTIPQVSKPRSHIDGF